VAVSSCARATDGRRGWLNFSFPYSLEEKNASFLEALLEVFELCHVPTEANVAGVLTASKALGPDVFTRLLPMLLPPICQRCQEDYELKVLLCAPPARCNTAASS
jgi:hypothetical protein